MVLRIRLPRAYIYHGFQVRPTSWDYCGSAMKVEFSGRGPVLSASVPSEASGLFSVSESHTLVRDELALSRQIGRMMTDGYDKLQVISDFDHTISVYRNGSMRMLTTHEAIERHPDIKQSTIQELRDLRSHFLPLETNPNLTASLRRTNLERWWNMSHELLVSEPITRRVINEVESFAPIALRKDFVKFANYLHDLHIPMTIFSAGLGDVIQQMLHSARVKMSAINVVANFLKFDYNGNALEFRRPTIHSQNKTLSTVLDLDAFRPVKSVNLLRPNVVLLGDSPHDTDMTKGHQFNCILKIGFLNEPDAARIEQYKQLYDVVLLDQESFSVPLKFLKLICSLSGPLP
ncbi:hypothetical protein FBUS_04917 [Fasciolopsis buskii]|uniref:5'-nucleotidase n=1 Tax=Fasciolopsis buskii TaxID=27845 RepID=A0A8E0RWC8_9TREM|nr:hypothetical protein FBUS_04917 [Fasciolopsis buski]